MYKEKLQAEFEVAINGWINLPATELIAKAEEIATFKAVHRYLMKAKECYEVLYLQNFKAPTEAITAFMVANGYKLSDDSIENVLYEIADKVLTEEDLI